MIEILRAKLLRSIGNQVAPVPADSELPGQKAQLDREVDTSVPERSDKPILLEVLDSLEPIGDEFPDIDEGLRRLHDVEL
jgi:antitoxin VapB